MESKLITRISYGMICIRMKEEPEIFLIKKRCTNAYYAIVQGKYNDAKNDEEILELLSFTTLEEKYALATMDFKIIWGRVWMSRNHSAFLYLKTKFYNNFNEKRLHGLIKLSTSMDLMWEVPKGHKQSKKEKNLDCAIRELKEETGIAKHRYRIITHRPIIVSNIYNNIEYIQKLYISVIKDPNYSPLPNIDPETPLAEVADMGWKTFTDLKVQKSENSEQMKHIFKRSVRIYKQYRK